MSGRVAPGDGAGAVPGERRVWSIEASLSPPETWIVALTDLDLAAEAQARAELTAVLNAGAGPVHLVDTTRVFVDVRGLSLLLDAADLASGRGHRLAVAPSDSLRRMCVALGLWDRLSLVPSARRPHDRPHDRPR